MKTGDRIDKRFLLKEICSSSGGMGEIFYVDDTMQQHNFPLVLKYCKQNDFKIIERFKREVSILQDFHGNEKVVQIVAANVEHTPPYFVMRYYPDGDLDRQRSWFLSNPTIQEKVFCNMIDCINELHVKNIFHRDIKPQNFLRYNENVVISDVGLSVEIDSKTTVLTSTTEVWRTWGYCPPEFDEGQFRTPDASSDIFMLGKTFYNLLTGRNPTYLTSNGIPAGIFHVIERACYPEKGRRYQRLSELKQALVGAYDIILGRIHGFNDSRVQLETIMSQLQTRQYDTDNVTKFIESVERLDEADANEILQSLVPDFFLVISQDSFDAIRQDFLRLYEKMVNNSIFEWAFAETIANCMNMVFQTHSVANEERALALQIAINAAISQNRFAAMHTCESMITSIDNNQKELAEHVVSIIIIQDYKDSFIGRIEATRCHNDLIINALRSLREYEE